MNKSADYILINGLIYTQNNSETAESIAVLGDKIVFVGGSAEALELADAGTKVIDLGGKVVIPGFMDSHTHPVCIALTDWRVPLKNTNDLTELLEDAADYCKKHSPEEVPYFLGESYQLTMFDENGPQKELLDKYINDRPARLQDFTDHSCWYNSRALELMGIEKGKPDPECIKNTPTEIKRDADGEPTGWVLEMPSDILEQEMYEKIGWRPPKYATQQSIKPFLDYISKCGVTGICDGFTEGEEAIRLFYDMDMDGSLNFYYEAMVLLPSFELLDETIDMLKRWRKKYTTKHIHIRTIKFFLDGTNEIGDCASLEPLRTDPTGMDCGNINMDLEQLTQTMVRLNGEGINMHLHIVGDRAFRTCCNAMEAAKKICGDDWNIRITSAHCELVHPDDRKRPSQLGMIINWSLHWSGGYFGDKSKDYLGEERFNTMYDFSEMIERGTHMAYSSDVFSYKEAKRANPFFGMRCGAEKIDPEFPLDPEKYPNSIRQPLSAAFSVSDMIYGYTAGSAYQMNLENEMGTIEAGKTANFIVLNKNPYGAKGCELDGIRPEKVFFDGKLIWDT